MDKNGLSGRGGNECKDKMRRRKTTMVVLGFRGF